MADGGGRPGGGSGLTRGETRVSLGTLNQQMALRAVFDTVCGTNGFVFVGVAARWFPEKNAGRQAVKDGENVAREG